MLSSGHLGGSLKDQDQVDLGKIGIRGKIYSEKMLDFSFAASLSP
jgi:hypothetical protein